MRTINLRTYYPCYYDEDMFLEVSDEVAEALVCMRREENNRTRKIYYHKAYYSLDQGDGIEIAASGWVQPSAEEIVIRQEEEQLFLVTLKRLKEALSCLTPVQARRIHARYMMGIKSRDIAASEGVCCVVVYDSIRSGLKKLRRYFEKQNRAPYQI